MDSVSSFESDRLAYESVRREIEILKAKLYDQVVIYVRNKLGFIKGLGDLQQYIDFKMCLENLPDSRRPEEPTWPAIFLDAFEPESAYLSTLSRSERVEYIRNEFDRMDRHLLELGYKFRPFDGDGECAEDCNDLEECLSSDGHPSCIEEEICHSRDPILDLATDDSVVSCSSYHLGECNPEEDLCEEVLQSDTGYENDNDFSISSEIQILKQLLHNELVIRIRHEVGDIKNLDDIQVFLNFWKALMSLHDSLRPERSAWPIIFLDVFIPDSINWLAHIRSERILQIEEFLSNLEVHMSGDSSMHVDSQNSKHPAVCDKVAEDDVLSSDYEGVSVSKESDICGQYDEDEYVPKNESCDSMITEDVPVSDHFCSQRDQSYGEVMLCTEEISELLAYDFERYIKSSIDSPASPVFSFASHEVYSPMFDVERDMNMDQSLSSLGDVSGVCSNTNTYEDFSDVEHTLKGTYTIVSDSSHADDTAYSFEYSYLEGCSTNSCARYDTSNVSDNCSNKDDDGDLCSMSECSSDDFSPHHLVPNPLVSSKEVSTSGRFDQNNVLLSAGNTDEDIACINEDEDGFRSWHADCIEQSGAIIKGDNLVCDSGSSSYSDWGIEGMHDSGVGSGFKAFNNALYNEEFDMDQPITCPNFYKGTLHGIINPLFEPQNNLSVEVGEVPDRQNFQDQPALHENISDDCSSMFISVSYEWEYSFEQKCGMQEPVFKIGYQYVLEYADFLFYSEQILSDVPSPLHCENDEGFFLMPVLVIKCVFNSDKRNERRNFGLPLLDVLENHVFDRGKQS